MILLISFDQVSGIIHYGRSLLGSGNLNNLQTHFVDNYQKNVSPRRFLLALLASRFARVSLRSLRHFLRACFHVDAILGNIKISRFYVIMKALFRVLM